MRVAVIGVGYWGPNIVRNLAEAPDAEIAAVSDLSEERLALIRKRFPSVLTTTDHRNVLRDPDIDGVCIATPVSTHHRLVLDALAAGKHVLVEKPLAASTEQGEEMVAAAERAGRILMVGHTFVYNNAVTLVRGLIESGEVGDVYYVDSQRVNLGLHQFDSNVVWDLGPHDVSIILYWLDDEPEWVACTGACYIQEGIEDVAFLTLGFRSGALAHSHLSWLAPGKRRTTTLVASEKMVIYDELGGAEKVKIFDHGVAEMSAEELLRSYRSGDILVPHISPTEPLQLEVRHFVQCIQEGRRPTSDGHAGVRVVRVLEAAVRSMREGGIRMPIASPHRSETVPRPT